MDHFLTPCYETSRVLVSEQYSELKVFLEDVIDVAEESGRIVLRDALLVSGESSDAVTLSSSDISSTTGSIISSYSTDSNSTQNNTTSTSTLTMTLTSSCWLQDRLWLLRKVIPSIHEKLPIVQESVLIPTLTTVGLLEIPEISEETEPIDQSYSDPKLLGANESKPATSTGAIKTNTTVSSNITSSSSIFSPHSDQALRQLSLDSYLTLSLILSSIYESLTSLLPSWYQIKSFIEQNIIDLPTLRNLIQNDIADFTGLESLRGFDILSEEYFKQRDLQRAEEARLAAQALKEADNNDTDNDDDEEESIGKHSILADSVFDLPSDISDIDEIAKTLEESGLNATEINTKDGEEERIRAKEQDLKDKIGLAMDSATTSTKSKDYNSNDSDTEALKALEAKERAIKEEQEMLKREELRERSWYRTLSVSEGYDDVDFVEKNSLFSGSVKKSAPKIEKREFYWTLLTEPYVWKAMLWSTVMDKVVGSLIIAVWLGVLVKFLLG